MDDHFPNIRLDPVTHASEFFAEFRAGDATPAVRTRFEKWLHSSPENVQAYLEIAAGWSELPTADPEDRLDLQALLAAARDVKDDNVVQLRLPQIDGARSPRPRRMRFRALFGSLVLLFVLTGGGIWVITQGALTYKTAIGEQRTLILTDGSTVVLNALTTIRVRFTRQAREVTLVRGQAYFHDTDKPACPFIVRVDSSAVRAIGTEFDIDKEPSRTIVTVLEGRVAVTTAFNWIDNIERRDLLRELVAPASHMNAVLVSAGEQVTVPGRDIPAPEPINVGVVTAWMQQRLIFDDTPLEAVAQQFNLYSARRLLIADPSLRNIGVSGVYSATDPSALIGFLRSQPTLRVVAKDDEFIVTRR